MSWTVDYPWIPAHEFVSVHGVEPMPNRPGTYCDDCGGHRDAHNLTEAEAQESLLAQRSHHDGPSND